MLDKIDPLAAALRNLEQQHDELNAAFASGKINGSQFENYSRKYRKHGESLPERLRQSEKQQKRMMNRLLLCNV